MRKFAGLLVAAALIVPAGIIAAAPAGAVAGASCKTLTGTATLKPGLSNTAAKNKPVITIKNAKLGGCTGGVTSGLLSATLKFGTANNCAGLAQGKSSNISGTSKVVWNNNTTSTLALKLVGVTGKPTQLKITGTVTVGKFKGSNASGTTEFKLPPGQCGTKPLTSPTFKQVTKIVI
jgi:hypothetical protein